MKTPITRSAHTRSTAGRTADTAGSDAQRAFARLSRQVEQAQRRLQAWRDAPDAVAARVASALAPAMAEQREAEHHLAIQLDALLTSPPKGLRLGAQRREALACYLLDLCRGLLAHGPDDTLLAIHDRHSQRSHAAMEEDTRADAMGQALAMLDAAFGEGAVRPLPGESDEAFYARAERRLFEAYEADRAREDAARARRAERRAARKTARDAAKAGAGGRRAARGTAHVGAEPAAAAQAAPGRGAGSRDTRFGPSDAPDTPAQDAPGADPAPEDRLRGLYRRLASALHPDRAPDGEARARRTLQMKALNAAWEARDLLAMLALQAEAALDGEQSSPSLPDAQARDYIALLQAQLERLKAEARRAADAATPPDIAIAHGRPRDAAQLLLWLEMDVQRVRRNAVILRDITAGLIDPGQRREVIDVLVERAEAALMRRALDAFIEDLAAPG